MGKNKPKGIKAEPIKEKTQTQGSEEMKRIPLGFNKKDPNKSK